MASTLPETRIDFEDSATVRRYARIISIAILGGAAAFAAVVTSMLQGATPMEAPKEHSLYMPFVIIAFGLVVIATIIGTRMHTFTGTLAERSRKTFIAHVASLALSEGAAFLGLVLVLMTRSWDVVLPAALGFAGLATSIIRGEIRFSGLVEEKNASG
jgi:hypothetical protein